jgi:predicted 3-demethylubiquinone-9 3-methyltransferase (glyoxalase superfamily)
MARITPFLWFDGKVEDAVHFYTSIFKKTHVTSLSPMSATFEIEGQRFIAFNGGPQYKFTEAVSFMIHCATQEEVDYFWSAHGRWRHRAAVRMGQDKFGLSWQVIPDVLGRYLGDKDREKAQRVLQAMLKMKKIDIAALDAAYAG